MNRSFALPWYEQNLRWLLAWAEGSQRALEFGCGVGWMTAALTRAGIPTLGIDLSEEKILHARDQHPDAAFEVLELREGTFAPGTFDFVVSNQVLEHVPDLETVLADLHRATAPAARAFFSVPNGFGLYCLLYDRLAGALGRESEHEQFRSLSQWTQAFRQGGFRVEKVLTQNVLPYRLLPGGAQRRLASPIHGLNRALCALTPAAWASAFFFCLTRIDAPDQAAARS